MNKHLLLAPAFCLGALSAHAQFVTAGGNTTTNDNVGIGTSSPSFKLDVSGSTIAERTIGIGSQPMLYLPDQSFSVLLGSSAFGNGLRFLMPGLGKNNTAVGVDAGYSMTEGYSNTSVGYSAMKLTTTGAGNTAVGTYALMDNMEGGLNTAFGAACLQYNTYGGQNSALGNGAMLFNSTGAGNSALGWQAMLNNTTGHWNTAIGAYTLTGNTTGSNNVAIGSLANVLSPDLSSATAIGYRAAVGKSNAIVLGDTSQPTTVGIGTAYPDYLLDVKAAANPVRLRGLQAGNATTDNIVTADANGVLRVVPVSSIGGGGTTITGTNGVTVSSSVAMLGDKCGGGKGAFREDREITMANRNLYFNANRIGKLYMGVSSCQPLMTRLEISIRGIGAVNGYDMTLPSLSGLRFTDLTAHDEPIENRFGGVLSLDEDGDVIWVRDGSGARPAGGASEAAYDELKTELADLKAELAQLKSLMKQSGATIPARDELAQNVPNPTGSATRIDYKLAAQGREAFIVVYDITGKVMERIALQNNAGASSVTLNISGWAAGTYSYALFVDGQIRATKKMQVVR